MSDSTTSVRLFQHNDTCPEYRTWRHIINRCTNRNVKDYWRYGGRGIKVSDEWRKSFQQFITDVGPRPSPEHSIDRIDNDGHYEKGNVKWSTRQEQGRNKRTNHNLSHLGMTKTLVEWAELTGLSERVIRGRLLLGWSVEDALRTPKRRKRQPQTALLPKMKAPIKFFSIETET